jgi:hypothetical protein
MLVTIRGLANFLMRGRIVFVMFRLGGGVWFDLMRLLLTMFLLSASGGARVLFLGSDKRVSMMV